MKLCLPADWIMNVQGFSPPSPTNGYFKTIFQLYLYHLKGLDSTLLVSFQTNIIYCHRVLRFFHFIIIFPSGIAHFMFNIISFVFQIMPLFIWHMSLNRYGYHIANVKHTAIMLIRQYTSNIFAHIYKNTNNYNSFSENYCQVCARNKYAPQMPYMPITSCEDIRQLCYHIYLKWTQYNQ